MRKCKICGTPGALIRSYKLYICRSCFREVAKSLGFEKFSDVIWRTYSRKR